MRHSTHNGFTLIEVTIAIGVTVFAMVAMMGMLPIGLNSFRDSKRASIDARIMQQLNAMLRLSDWSTSANGATGSAPESSGNNAVIMSYSGVEYYFDASGTQIGSSTKPPRDTNKIAFTALLSIDGASGPSGSVTLPGSNETNSYLLNVTVLVTDLPANLKDRFTFTNCPQLKRSQNTFLYTTLLSQTSGA